MYRSHLILSSLLLISLLALPAGVLADSFDPPAGYYSSATGTGSTLKGQLHNTIDNHTVRSYDAARSLLQITDRDPADPDRMMLVYDRVSIDVSAINPGGSIPGWDNAATWNREHTWPKSRGVNSSGADSSDLHQLRPSDTRVNSDRGNLNFGGAYGMQSFGPVYDGGDMWYPGDADAGMIARQEFYMAVRYDGSDSSTEDLELASGNPGIGSPRLANLNRMIQWHFAAVPDDFERRRNDIIYDDYQHNRNPFIDRPEFVWSVFVDQRNDSRISIAGTTVGSNGSSVANVGLGRVLVGAAVPSSQSITLTKSGNDGTYFQVSASGDATSSLFGRYHAFRTGGTDDVVVSVGLDTNTVSAGARSGSVTIDNLDVTTGGGAGRGGNDGNDQVVVSLDVLDHANASFSGESDLNLLSFDFGTVTEGDVPPTWDFELFNRESAMGFTADLDLDNVVGAGDTSILTTNMVPMTGTLDAGSNHLFTASFDTSAVGDYSAMYRIEFSDEDLPGANSLDDLFLFVSGTIEEAVVVTADFDQDSDVDGNDLLAWQRGWGLDDGVTLAHGDANGDRVVDEADLAVWQRQFGVPVAARTVPVPEPTALWPLVALLLAFGFRVNKVRVF